jgi:hypothetical protein
MGLFIGTALLPFISSPHDSHAGRAAIVAIHALSIGARIVTKSGKPYSRRR